VSIETETLPHSEKKQPSRLTSTREHWAALAQHLATLGFILYAAFAPHSIAAAEISLAIVGAGSPRRAVAEEWSAEKLASELRDYAYRRLTHGELTS